MTPKKKKIYIAIIVVCLTLSAAAIIYTQMPPSTQAPGSRVFPTNSGPSASGVAATPTGNAQSGFTPPAVFPATDKFNTDVLKNLNFQNLQTYQGPDIKGQLGRPNPFNSF